MTSREFAIQVVSTLQAAGHEALWAGGCVRDQLVGRTPKDYDVATSAVPETVREIFGKKKTLAIGASFGVITVLGPKGVDPIEIATFRRDGGYSDGRRPDGVEFTDAREDAMRRDFTINGMFFDPIKEEVIDFVGGKADLQAEQVRAIGDPNQRIEEDKLRMLRGVRFASTFGFDLEANTLKAIQEHASEINVVSGERIGAEMRKMLSGQNRADAARLLRESRLLTEILPTDTDELVFQADRWDLTLASLKSLASSQFSPAVSILLDPVVKQQGVDRLAERWKLSNEEKKSISWICNNREALEKASQLPWSKVQPLLLSGEVECALDVAEAYQAAGADVAKAEGIRLCRERLSWPADKLNPAPFLDGKDLMKLGIEKGPKFKQVLNAIRIAQLDGEISSVEEARSMATNV